MPFRKMVKVVKATDASQGPQLNHEFNTEWLKRSKNFLRPRNIIVSGTMHVIYSIGFAMQQLE